MPKESSSLLIPVYINEKTVLDMLAILEDGFSMVSLVSSIERSEEKTDKEVGANLSLLMNKFLKIETSGDYKKAIVKDGESSVSTSKIHTNASLLSKFRDYLADNKMLKTEANVELFNVGDFIELEGELQKNPIIDYLDSFLNLLRLAEVFSNEQKAGGKKGKGQDQQTMKQVQSFLNELKHSGTIDFIMKGSDGTIVLSALEQYLENDNVSELLGGSFKVLGKVIAVRKSDDESIDLLRKTTLSILPEHMLENLFSGFQNEGLSELKLPELISKIPGPAAIVLPIAIYA